MLGLVKCMQDTVVGVYQGNLPGAQPSLTTAQQGRARQNITSASQIAAYAFSKARHLPMPYCASFCLSSLLLPSLSLSHCNGPDRCCCC
jgi:hypothetical protein